MKFYVTDQDYERLSGPFDTLLVAATSALYHVALGRTVKTALVLGMESETYRTDVPAHVLLRVSATSELERF